MDRRQPLRQRHTPRKVWSQISSISDIAGHSAEAMLLYALEYDRMCVACMYAECHALSYLSHEF